MILIALFLAVAASECTDEMEDEPGLPPGASGRIWIPPQVRPDSSSSDDLTLAPAHLRILTVTSP